LIDVNAASMSIFDFEHLKRPSCNEHILVFITALASQGTN